MKTRPAILVLIIVCFSCCKNNNIVPDGQKEKIKSEIKEVVDTFFKGCEEANFDKAIKSFLDSPDFVCSFNGNSFDYRGMVDVVKPVFSTIENQGSTLVNEKYAFLDKLTVLYTASLKWITNFKDGSAISQDPGFQLFVFKKIDNRWRVIYVANSGVEKNLPSQSSETLDQSELLRKFAGDWVIPVAGDTALFISVKSFRTGKGFYVSDKLTAKGKTLAEGTGFWAYDDAMKKINLSLLRTDGEVIQNIGAFTSANAYEYANVNNSPSYTGVTKCVFEFTSPDEIKGKFIFNDQEFIQTMNRVKN